jgi:hypothetical protein
MPKQNRFLDSCDGSVFVRVRVVIVVRAVEIEPSPFVILCVKG